MTTSTRAVAVALVVDLAIGAAKLLAFLITGSTAIMGAMIESHLVAGKQAYRPGGELTYGQSITDACVGWDDTVPLLERLAAAVRQRRGHKVQASA